MTDEAHVRWGATFSGTMAYILPVSVLSIASKCVHIDQQCHKYLLINSVTSTCKVARYPRVFEFTRELRAMRGHSQAGHGRARGTTAA